MYKKTSGSIVVFLVLYVDDILLIGNDIPTLLNVKQMVREMLFNDKLRRSRNYTGYKDL